MFKWIIAGVAAVCVIKCCVSKETINNAKADVRETWDGGLDQAKKNWNDNTSWECLKIKDKKAEPEAAAAG